MESEAISQNVYCKQDSKRFVWFGDRTEVPISTAKITWRFKSELPISESGINFSSFVFLIFGLNPPYPICKAHQKFILTVDL